VLILRSRVRCRVWLIFCFIFLMGNGLGWVCGVVCGVGYGGGGLWEWIMGYLLGEMMEFGMIILSLILGFVKKPVEECL